MEPVRQLENEHLGYSDTPKLASGYTVHDGTRPQMPVVDAQPDQVPSDAVVLFDGRSLEGWRNVNNGEACGWQLREDGAMEVVPGVGDIQTEKEFGSMQLHVEFMSPVVVKGQGQGRGNSGVFLMGRYEIQVLDNYENPTYPDGTVGGIYGQTPPLVNPIRKPGEWNEYDILWKAPEFNGEDLVSPAVVTVLLNGVVQHHAVTLKGPTEHKVLPGYKAHPAKGPLKLQDHGDLVRFRNIWVREL
ncbi:DUF1080 domain-containing protein [Kiritimatiellaeota bacterium B1221]|nr:DUF1080 domain-containing protein [Kiritimatiellaeota bacterium B1221]